MSATPDESRALALVVNSSEGSQYWAEAQSIPPLLWSKMTPGLTDLAEQLFEQLWGRPIEHTLPEGTATS